MLTMQQVYRQNRAEIKRFGFTPTRAVFGNSDDCIFCGEAGRCPGYHAAEEIYDALGAPVRDSWKGTP